MTAIEPGRAHIWRFDLDSPNHGDYLSDDEHERARRLPAIEGRRFSAGRSALRLLLSAYVGTDPELLEFAYGPEGKPSLAGRSINFSLSHSGAVMIVAVASGPVGIDIERIREIDYRRILRDFFPESEAGCIFNLPEGEQMGAFFRLWTCKEALAKALGVRLTKSIATYSVPSGWVVQTIESGPCMAAVAAKEGTELVIMDARAHEILLNQGSEPYRHGPE